MLMERNLKLRMAKLRFEERSSGRPVKASVYLLMVDKAISIFQIHLLELIRDNQEDLKRTLRLSKKKKSVNAYCRIFFQMLHQIYTSEIHPHDKIEENQTKERSYNLHWKFLFF
jgi:hypothetical protein